ncbi:vitamin K epoxide reductase family protein [Frigoribacterium sp. UYMn621]|uniref:vitamin K epoxide reductase family protein n=1 Tax=Frigoribacterium sp. UYMn621 TaxID=3156343 RepID=UPI00339B90DC
MTTTPPATPSPRGTLLLTATGAAGVLVSFASTVIAFVGIESASGIPKLLGADNELGYPSSPFSMALFVIALTVGAAQFSGARISAGWWRAIATIFAVGVLFQVWALYLAVVPHLAVSWLLAAQLVLMALVFALAVPRLRRDGRPLELGMFLAVASVAGFFAAFRLTVDKVGTFTTPGVAPSCNVSVLVQCGKNLSSWQGSLFGFPNPLIGVGGWMAMFMIAVLIISGVTFARWFWIALNVGITLALVFVIFLITESIFMLGTLCPWCMATWSVVIPSFWLITFFNLKSGHIPVSARLRDLGAAAYGYVPLITLVSYVVVAALAQVQLDVIHRL